MSLIWLLLSPAVFPPNGGRNLNARNTGNGQILEFTNAGVRSGLILGRVGRRR